MAIEFRWAEGEPDRLPALADDLVKRQVAVIISVGGTAPLAAAKSATSTIPIVFHMGADPVRLGFVRSFNRPGGDVTGISLLQVAMAEKRLEVLRELVPAAKIIGLLANPANPTSRSLYRACMTRRVRSGFTALSDTAAARAMLTSRSKASFGDRVQALLVDGDAVFLSRRQQITALAARHSVPTSTYLDCMSRKAVP